MSTNNSIIIIGPGAAKKAFEFLGEASIVADAERAWKEGRAAIYFGDIKHPNLFFRVKRPKNSPVFVWAVPGDVVCPSLVAAVDDIRREGLCTALLVRKPLRQVAFEAGLTSFSGVFPEDELAEFLRLAKEEGY